MPTGTAKIRGANASIRGRLPNLPAPVSPGREPSNRPWQCRCQPGSAHSSRRPEHRVLLALGHAIAFAFVEVSQTEVFHRSSPLAKASGTTVADFSVTVSSNEAQHILI